MFKWAGPCIRRVSARVQRAEVKIHLSGFALSCKEKAHIQMMMMIHVSGVRREQIRVKFTVLCRREQLIIT